MSPINGSNKMTAAYLTLVISGVGVTATLAGLAGGAAYKVFAPASDVAALSAQMKDMQTRQDRIESNQDRMEAKLDKVYGILIKK